MNKLELLPFLKRNRTDMMKYVYSRIQTDAEAECGKGSLILPTNLEWATLPVKCFIIAHCNNAVVK